MTVCKITQVKFHGLVYVVLNSWQMDTRGSISWNIMLHVYNYTGMLLMHLIKPISQAGVCNAHIPAALANMLMPKVTDSPLHT